MYLKLARNYIANKEVNLSSRRQQSPLSYWNPCRHSHTPSVLSLQCEFSGQGSGQSAGRERSETFHNSRFIGESCKL